jgi:hypothetical protein
MSQGISCEFQDLEMMKKLGALHLADLIILMTNLDFFYLQSAWYWN